MKFRLCFRRAAAILLLGFAVQLHAQSRSRFTYNGLTLTTYGADAYLDSAPAAVSLRATGANVAAIIVTQYVQTSTANVIAPETAATPGYPAGFPTTPTDEALATGIRNLQAQGLAVSVKPQVDSVDGVFRALFAPSDVAAWLASYQIFLLRYAQIAAENHADMLVIGTELKSLTGPAYALYWKALIAQVRRKYPGLTLTYAANATGAGDEFSTVSFWDDLDLIGVDGYIPLTGRPDPSVHALMAAWTRNRYGFNMVNALRRLHRRYGKPVIFTEAGYVSVAATNTAPYALMRGAYDAAEQRNCYEAFFRVFQREASWMKGVFFWDWTLSPPDPRDTGYSPQGKPAGTTLTRWFGGTSQTGVGGSD